jgi:Flp pilus assembly pilin Flp
MRIEPRPTGDSGLYWLVALAVFCGALVLTGAIREAWTSLSRNLDVIAR